MATSPAEQRGQELQLAVVANLFTLLPGTHDDVAFGFTSLDDGSWWIDDVYVDPFRHG